MMGDLVDFPGGLAEVEPPDRPRLEGEEDLRRLEARLVEVARTLGLDERDAVRTLVGRLRHPARRRRPSLAGALRRAVDLQRKLRMVGRSPEVDEFGYDPVYAEVTYPAVDLAYERYFRVQLRGASHLPRQGAGMLVCNHGGGIPLDALLLAHAVRYKVFPPRPCRALVEDLFITAPYIGPALRRLGLVRADRRNARRLLENGQLVAVFPEGIKGLGKHFEHRYRVQRFGRGGYVRVALATSSPIVPVAIVGHDETYPILARFDALGRVLGLPFAPVTLNALIGGPLGLLPLPTRWTIRFGEPLDLARYGPDAADDDLLVNRVNQIVRATVQRLVHEEVARRRSVWLG